MNPKCAVVSDFNPIAIKLVERLTTNNLDIQIVTADKKQWQQGLRNLGIKNVEVCRGKCKNGDKINYAILIDLKGKSQNLKEFVNAKKVLITRTIFEIKENFDKKILIGELVDKEISADQSLIREYLSKISKSNRLLIQDKDQHIYISKINAIIDPILREIFTYSGEDVVIGYKTSLYQIFKLLKTHKKTEILRDPTIRHLQVFMEGMEILTPMNLERDIDLDITQVVVEKKKVMIPLNLHVNPKYALSTIMAVVAILVLPYVILVVSGASILLVGEYSLKGEITKARGLNKFASATSSVSREMFLVYSRVYLVGDLYEKGYEASDVLSKVSSIGTDSFLALDYISEVSRKVLGASDTDLENLSNQLYLTIDDVYKKSSFLVDDIVKYTNIFSGSVTKQKLEEGRSYLYNAREITSSLPILLGLNEPQTYLVLFQNNMELRPTGGFIGSFALVTFDKGKMVEKDVYDVYSADGQLKGYVTPPEAIRDYLGEAAWYMRDSNWSADFPTSSKRAEWFLDKSLDQKVDGVIGINLEAVRAIIEATGSIELPDYNDTLTSSNFYEKIQSEVEDDFFPGSRKKANYLTAVANAAINRIANINSDNATDFYKKILEKLNSRDIQIYLHNTSASESLKNLGWDGSIQLPGCAIDNCEETTVGLVEANVGVNKVNTTIDRQAQLFVEINNEYVDYKLAVSIQNNGNVRYKNYMRVITNKDVEFLPAQVFSGDEVYSVAPEIKDMDGFDEAGVLINTQPGAESRVVYNWRTQNNLDFEGAGQINFLIRKQSGVSNMPFELSVKNNTSLTMPGPFRYNTTLSRDFRQNFNW